MMKLLLKTDYEVPECLKYSFQHQNIQTASIADKGKEANSECQVQGWMDL